MRERGRGWVMGVVVGGGVAMSPTCLRRLKPAYEIPTPTTHDMKRAPTACTVHAKLASCKKLNSPKKRPRQRVGGMERTGGAGAGAGAGARARTR